MPFFFCCLFLCVSGFYRNSEEEAGLLEAAGPQIAPPLPSESYAGHACVPTERVSLSSDSALFYLWSPSVAVRCYSSWIRFLDLTVYYFHSLSLPFSVLQFSDACCLRSVFPFYSSWTYGSNSLPTAGSVSGVVGRRGQRPFPMTPRGLPAGRISLLSPGGIGGASPRHTLTNPVLAGQGRQVSTSAIGSAFLTQGCDIMRKLTWSLMLWTKWIYQSCQVDRKHSKLMQ